MNIDRLRPRSRIADPEYKYPVLLGTEDKGDDLRGPLVFGRDVKPFETKIVPSDVPKYPVLLGTEQVEVQNRRGVGRRKQG